MNTQKPRETAQSLVDCFPFDETVDAQCFYPGGNRQEILDELLRTIASKVSVVTLTGDEGSGKTMMCRMVEQKISANYVAVFFSQAVDSFEDVVRLVARRLEVEPVIASGDIPRLLQAIAAILREREARLLIIFDEAERVYLATLERIRKMLDQINASGPLLQIVLSGRSGLHNNFKNLALCNFQVVEEKHFTLGSLSREETIAYLNHATKHIRQADKQGTFTRETAEKIFAVSSGNFRLIKALAKDSLLALGPDTSFLVLLDNVQEVEEKTKPRRRLKPAATKKVRLNRRNLVWGGGVFCAVLVIFLLMQPGQKSDLTSVESSPEAQNKIAISQPESIGRLAENSVETPSADQIVKEPEKEKTSLPIEMAKPAKPENEKAAAPPPPMETVQFVEPKKEKQATQLETAQPAVSENEKNAALSETVKPNKPENEKPAVLEKTARPVTAEKGKVVASAVKAQLTVPKKEKPDAPVKVTLPAEPGKKEVAPAVTIKAKEAVKHGDRMVANAVKESPQKPIHGIQQEKNKIAEIKLMKPAKIKSDTIKEQSMQKQTVAPVIRRMEVPKVVKAKPAPVKEPTTVKKSAGGDRLYSHRISAGTPWLLGLKDDRYTVQLMVISNSDDEEKLKKLLAQESFQGQADKVYILRKESAPDVKYVFYGEYPTMTDARNARNTIPKFLRGNKPYAMSVKGAVRKVQQEE